MSTSCNKFLKAQLAKGGQSAYVTWLMLTSIEKNKKDLLKRANLSFIQSNYQRILRSKN